MMEVAFMKTHEDAKLPERGKPGDAGVDLFAVEYTKIYPGESKKIATGVAVELPIGMYGRVAGRSGLAFKHDIWAFEGTVDENYRGEIGVLLMNTGLTYYEVFPGDRVAQLIVIPYLLTKPYFTDKLSDTVRGEQGYGSSGR
jgi:dUTP pyrophosphatase